MYFKIKHISRILIFLESLPGYKSINFLKYVVNNWGQLGSSDFLTSKWGHFARIKLEIVNLRPSHAKQVMLEQLVTKVNSLELNLDCENSKHSHGNIAKQVIWVALVCIRRCSQHPSFNSSLIKRIKLRRHAFRLLQTHS